MYAAVDRVTSSDDPYGEMHTMLAEMVIEVSASAAIGSGVNALAGRAASGGWMSGSTILGADSATALNASRMLPESGIHQVLLHGTPDGFIVNGAFTSAKDVARMMLQSGFQRGTPVRLISCHTGVFGDGAAYQLSRYLRSPVIGPTNKVRILEGGGYEIFGEGNLEHFLTRQLNRMKLVGFVKKHNCIKEAVDLDDLISNTLSETNLNIEKIIKYLNSGALLLAWMGYFIDGKSKKLIAPDSYFTDGIWVWPSYFPYYLKAYPFIKINSDFLTHLENKNFEFSLEDKFEIQKEQLEKELSVRLNAIS